MSMFIIAMLLAFANGNTQERITVFFNNAELNGFSCKSKSFTVDAYSLIHCCAMCKTVASCVNAFYNRQRKVCTGCSGGNGDMDEDTSFNYFYESYTKDSGNVSGPSSSLTPSNSDVSSTTSGMSSTTITVPGTSVTVKRTTSIVPNTTPVTTIMTSTIQQPTSNVEQSTTTVQQSTTTVQQSTTNVEQSTTTVQQPTTAVQQPTTTVQQSTTNVQQSTTAVQQPTTTVQQSTTAVQQPTTTVQQSTTAVQQSTTAVQQPTTTVQQSTTNVEQSTASVQQSTTTALMTTTEHQKMTAPTGPMMDFWAFWNGSEYKLVHTMDFHSAAVYCKEITRSGTAGYLVWVESENENDFVRTVAMVSEQEIPPLVFIGHIQSDHEIVYYPGGPVITYYHKKIQQGDGQCVAMVTDKGTWVMTDCQLTIPAVCERGASNG